MSLLPGERNALFQQMGEVLTSIRSLQDIMEVRQSQAERLYDLVRSDLVTLRQDQRELEDKFECIVYVLRHEVEAVRSSTTENGRSIDDMVVAIEAIQKPVAEILGLKARVAGLVFGAGLIGSAALWLAEPVYGWLVNSSFSKH